MLKEQLEQIIDSIEKIYKKNKFKIYDQCAVDIIKRNISDLPKIYKELNECIDKYNKIQHDYQSIDLLLLINRRLALISWTVTQVREEVEILFSKLITQEIILSDFNS